jgi:hypothetical protein
MPISFFLMNFCQSFNNSLVKVLQNNLQNLLQIDVHQKLGYQHFLLKVCQASNAINFNQLHIKFKE